MDPKVASRELELSRRLSISMMAQIALDAYQNTSYAADPIKCHDCREAWGWTCCHDKPPYGRVPIEKFQCCNKVI